MSFNQTTHKTSAVALERRRRRQQTNQTVKQYAGGRRTTGDVEQKSLSRDN